MVLEASCAVLMGSNASWVRALMKADQMLWGKAEAFGLPSSEAKGYMRHHLDTGTAFKPRRWDLQLR